MSYGSRIMQPSSDQYRCSVKINSWKVRGARPIFMGAGPFSPLKSARVYGAGELRAAAEAAVTHQKRARERPSRRQITGSSCLAHISGAIITGLRTRSVQNG